MKKHFITMKFLTINLEKTFTNMCFQQRDKIYKCTLFDKDAEKFANDIEVTIIIIFYLFLFLFCNCIIIDNFFFRSIKFMMYTIVTLNLQIKGLTL